MKRHTLSPVAEMFLAWLIAIFMICMGFYLQIGWHKDKQADQRAVIEAMEDPNAPEYTIMEIREMIRSGSLDE